MADSRLVRIFLMLGSDNDGEVVNAARHLDKWLKANGKDWHKLAAHMERFDDAAAPRQSAAPRQPNRPHFTFKQPVAQPKPKPTPRPQQGITVAEMVSQLAAYRDHSKPMATVEEKFVDKIWYRFDAYKDKTFVSWEDMEFIKKLHMKYITRTSP